MKKFVVISNVVDEECFINEVVNEMPGVCGARFEWIDMENCILVEDNEKSIDAAKIFLKKNNVRFVID